MKTRGGWEAEIIEKTPTHLRVRHTLPHGLMVVAYHTPDGRHAHGDARYDLLDAQRDDALSELACLDADLIGDGK